jgi:hypothetical protein
MKTTTLGIIPLLAVLLAAGISARADGRDGGFRFALVGDYNYGPPGGPEWQASERMVAAVNAAGVRFTVHLGDIQSGGQECSDAVVEATRAQFARFKAPLVYLFGDNEWTDCHRHRATHPQSPFLDPLERLAHLRRVFYPAPKAQGGGRLALERQADLSRVAGHRRFVENVRWEAGGVLFVGLNVPGSNNNHSGGSASRQAVKVPGQDEEWQLRDAANRAWLRAAFRRARARRDRAVFVAWQANPDFENKHPDLPRYDSNGYRELLATLAEQAARFPGPVVLAHGDSHNGLRVDRPWPLPNFVRVENYGPPHTDWTRVTVRPERRGPALFEFEGMAVPGNGGPPGTP